MRHDERDVTELFPQQTAPVTRAPLARQPQQPNPPAGGVEVGVGVAAACDPECWPLCWC